MEFIKPASQGCGKGWSRQCKQEPSVVPGAGWSSPHPDLSYLDNLGVPFYIDAEWPFFRFSLGIGGGQQ